MYLLYNRVTNIILMPLKISYASAFDGKLHRARICTMYIINIMGKYHKLNVCDIKGRVILLEVS